MEFSRAPPNLSSLSSSQRFGVDWKAFRVLFERMGFSPRELEVCGVSLEQIQDILQLLRSSLAASVTKSIEASSTLSIGDINRLCTCATLVRQLSLLPGFPSIRKRIAKFPTASIYEPRGEWFQLLMGYFLTKLDDSIQFEQSIQGKRHDVTLRRGTVIVECKYFDHGGREDARISDLFRTGQVPPETHEMPGFRTAVSFWPPIPWLPNTPVVTDHYGRFFANAIHGKYVQLVEDRPGIIAFNTNWLSNETRVLRTTLGDLLSLQQYPRISAFLLVEQASLSSDDYDLKGTRYRLDLVTNPLAPQALPPDLMQSLTDQMGNRLVGLQ